MTEPIDRPLSERLDGEVLADEGTRSAYASDASNHRVVPLCVVLPRSVDDVATAVTLCSEAGVPITSRGAGTSIAGSAIGPGVVLDFSRHLNRIVSVDPDSQTATVEPGVVLDQLQLAAQPHGLRFGPDPSSHNRCTIGGMIGTNACGSHSVAWGTTADSVNTLDVLLADGSPNRLGRTTSGRLADDLGSVRDGALAPIRRHLGRFPRQISGYALQHLLPENGFDLAKAFVGSEGTCAVVVSATVGLVRLSAHRTLVVAGFPDDVSAAAAAPELAGLGPLTVEGIGDTLVRAFDTRPGPQPRPDLPAGRAWLLMEVGRPHLPETTEAAAALARAAGDAGALETVVLTSATAQRALWLVRERGAGLATRTAAGTEAWPGWEDSAVPPERLADYLRDLHRLLADHGRAGVVYGHFGEG
ncbi:MAG: FAD-binding oxidoreductase, partial [Actinomycetota bacterium]|nr:FAD-binding oxidoreductase [Actinomycetota bacterium]